MPGARPATRRPGAAALPSPVGALCAGVVRRPAAKSLHGACPAGHAAPGSSRTAAHSSAAASQAAARPSATASSRQLARATAGVDLPTEDIAELRRSVFRPDFKSLEEYLAPFAFTVGVMQNAENLERIAYEFAVDNFTEGVRYFEVRYAPQLHCSVDPALEFGIVEVFQAVHSGLSRARNEFNDALRADNMKGARTGEPHYDFGIIACAMRMFFPGMSRYYDALFALHPHADAPEVTSMASVNLVLAAKEALALLLLAGCFSRTGGSFPAGALAPRDRAEA